MGISTVMVYHHSIVWVSPITVIGDLFYVIFFFTVPSCDPPQLPENVDFRLPHQKKTRSFKFQEKVLLKCQTGYFQNGIGLLTCKTKGKWTVSSFTCSRKLKTPPTIPESLGQIYNHSHYKKQTLVCLTKARGDEKKRSACGNNNDNNDNNSGELLRVVIFVARFERQWASVPASYTQAVKALFTLVLMVKTPVLR